MSLLKTCELVILLLSCPLFAEGIVAVKQDYYFCNGPEPTNHVRLTGILILLELTVHCCRTEETFLYLCSPIALTGGLALLESPCHAG